MASSKPKSSKYGNKKTVVDGIKFDSKAEARYYVLNKHKPRMERQVKFELLPKFECCGKKYRAITYNADFVFYDPEGNPEKVVDVKGVQTDVFRLKAKWFMSKYKIPLILAVYDKKTGLFEEKRV